MEYRHLTLEERTVIMIYVQTGQRVEAAARVLRRSAATIRRELARNPSPYEAVAAHARAAEVTRWRRRRKLTTRGCGPRWTGGCGKIIRPGRSRAG